MSSLFIIRLIKITKEMTEYMVKRKIPEQYLQECKDKGIDPPKEELNKISLIFKYKTRYPLVFLYKAI